MEIQQTPYYADYIRSLGWIVETADKQNVFIKPFPFIGGIAKIQRTMSLPQIKGLLPLFKKYAIRTLVIEPDHTVNQNELTRWCKKISRYVKVNRDPYIPTKTIRVDVEPAADDMFRRFSEAKRRAVRRAAKYGITATRSGDIDALIRLKNRSAGFLGFITTAGVRKLWNILPSPNKGIVLANDSSGRVVGGVFLIFWDNIGYYWIAGALKTGKKQFAPTLLVWEALKFTKERKCKALDFVGVWDERLPDKNHEWKGFTKFKEGFGGTELYYPLPALP